MKKLLILLSIVIRVTACAEPTDPVQPLMGSISATASDAAWTATAFMTETRYDQAAAAGADGRIFVFSGLRRAVLTSAEVYDPAQNVWSYIASPGGQAGAGAVRGSDGRIYLVGGIDESFNPLKRVQAYNPRSDTWAAVADMNNQRQNHGVAVGADGRVYAFGGTVNGFEALKSAEVSDAAVSQWTHIAQMNVERQAFAAAAGRDGRIYAFGGMTNQDVTASAEVYDPGSDTWSPIADMPEYRFGHAAARGADGLIYVFGGRGASGYQSSVFAYNPVTNSWSVIASMSVARYLPAAAAGNDGNVYVIGGKSSSSVILASAERYLTALPNRPPVASAGTDQTVEALNGQAQVRLDASESSDPDGDPLTYEWRENGTVVASAALADLQLGLGVHTFTLRVTDPDGASSDDEVVVTVILPPNRPPVASAGPDQTAECVAGCAHVTLNGSASSDPDGDQLSYEWRENDVVIARGAVADVQLDLGVHRITLRVADESESAEDEVIVTVADTHAPTITFSQMVTELRPNAHLLRPVAVVSASDACDPSARLEVSVSSNEPENGTGDGDTAPDWQIVPSGDGFQVWVRAERSGSGIGRIYTITATATDRAGNQVSSRKIVLVSSTIVKSLARPALKVKFEI